MTIQYENVQFTPRLPFKYYEHDATKGVNVPPHWHHGIEINYLVTGTALKFVTDGVTKEYHPGDIWAINHRVIHSISGPSKVDWLEFGLIVDDSVLQSSLLSSPNWQINLQNENLSKSTTAAYEALKKHFIAIHDLIHCQTNDVIRMKILSHFFMVLAILAESFTTPMIEQDINPNSLLVDTVMNVINEDYSRQITGTMIASQFHVSLTTLNQQFGYTVQMSVNKYIRLVRLLNARRLLLETNKAVSYIAGECGFASDKTFYRNFKAWKGVTPSAYRRKYAKYHKNDTRYF
ncbi:AraC family transcriptional regulator [Lactobacillus sp. UCMA15818]|uniref:helix-turn-helix domain-containing protein n=1 Tax=Lactobacillus sp. UCMA15818 TaxID=2583394 RepID=UPI0025B184FD|nr:AraC family transcriptional regulator [Lactobacillus sp. UCMA15818]MDN2452188.1 AraC family transcriptional regulator [Lactobacillus sp. UCMA15818]